MTPLPLRIERLRHPTHHEIRLAGELTEGEYDLFDEQVFQPVDTDPAPVVLVLEALEYVSSSGLGSFTRLSNRLAEAGHKLALAGPRPVVRDLLRHVHLDRLISVHDRPAQAVSAVLPAEGAG